MLAEHERCRRLIQDQSDRMELLWLACGHRMSAVYRRAWVLIINTYGMAAEDIFVQQAANGGYWGA